MCNKFGKVVFNIITFGKKVLLIDQYHFDLSTMYLGYAIKLGGELYSSKDISKSFRNAQHIQHMLVSQNM